MKTLFFIFLMGNVTLTNSAHASPKYNMQNPEHANLIACAGKIAGMVAIANQDKSSLYKRPVFTKAVDQKFIANFNTLAKLRARDEKALSKKERALLIEKLNTSVALSKKYAAKELGICVDFMKASAEEFESNCSELKPQDPQYNEKVNGCAIDNANTPSIEAKRQKWDDARAALIYKKPHAQP
jgi:hypothetical protein